ncbi:MAG: GPW/gp25 family protein [Allosphingosinicella sp.]
MSLADRPPPLRLYLARVMDRLRRLVGAPSKAEDIRRNIQAILSTRPGERVMRPEFGCAIHDLMFEPIGPAMLEEMRRRVAAAILCWELRIELTDVQARAGDSGSGVVLIELEYAVRSSGERALLVFPIQMFG